MKAQIVLLFLASASAQAKDLRELHVNGVCTPQELALEPMTQNRFYAEPRWLEKLNATKASREFDPTFVRKFSDKAPYDGLSSAKLSQHLANAIKGLRAKQIELIAKGELKPAEQNHTYPQSELEKRIASVDEFRRKHLFPMLETNYQLYLRTLHENHTKTSAPLDPAFKDIVEKQRTYLNDGLKELLPSVVQKLGSIAEYNGTRAPLIYRDGRIIKIRLGLSPTESVLLSPPLLLNRLNQEDQYFIEALKLWRDYTRTQYEQALKENSALLELKRKAFDLAESDLSRATNAHHQLARLTREEILSLMDLFRALNAENIPQCSSQIRKLNQMMATKLSGSSSTRKLKGPERAHTEALAKDVIFYQDAYDVFSRVPVQK